MNKRARAALTLLALLAVAGWGAWWQARQSLAHLAFPQRRLAFLEAETRRLQTLLADKQREVDTVCAQKWHKDIEASVERLRGLSFLNPVVYKEIPRTELPAILRAKLGQQVPDQEFDRTGVALAALGLIPGGTDLKKTYLGLLGEQVGAFYDQHSGELFTFSGQSLANSQNQIILAHELTHALEDQHFHLANLPLEAKGNDDRVLAATALVEGDATLVMDRYMIGTLSTASIREGLVATVATDVRQLAAAPRFLRETLLFPYLRGQEFCQRLYDRGGWAALARAFAHPPASTSLILHPDRFLDDPSEQPAAVNFPDAALLGEQPIDDNVLGEFGLRQWLVTWSRNETQAAETAAGWKGDRYLVYGGPQAASYVWETVWRSPGEAAGFGAAAVRALDGGAMTSAKSPAASVDTSPEQTWIQGSRRLAVIVDAPAQRVLIINAQDAKWFDALRGRFATGVVSAPTSSRP